MQSGIKSNDVTNVGGSTSRLDKKFPCVRQRFGHSNRQCTYATHRTEVVPASVLYKPKNLEGRAKLLHNRKGGSRDGVVPTLLVRTQVLISCGLVSTNLLGLQGVANRKNSTMDTPTTRV